MTLVVSSPDARGDFGSVYVNAEGYIERFAEKQGSSSAPYLNAGIYVVARSLLRDMPIGVAASLEQEIFPRWLGEGRRLKVFVCSRRCVDIGTPDRYQSAQDILACVEPESGVPNCEDQT